MGLYKRTKLKKFPFKEFMAKPQRIHSDDVFFPLQMCKWSCTVQALDSVRGNKDRTVCWSSHCLVCGYQLQYIVLFGTITVKDIRLEMGGYNCYCHSSHEPTNEPFVQHVQS